MSTSPSPSPLHRQRCRRRRLRSPPSPRAGPCSGGRRRGRLRLRPTSTAGGAAAMESTLMLGRLRGGPIAAAPSPSPSPSPSLFPSFSDKRQPFPSSVKVRALHALAIWSGRAASLSAVVPLSSDYGSLWLFEVLGG